MTGLSTVGSGPSTSRYQVRSTAEPISDTVTVTVVDDEVGKTVTRGTEDRDTNLGTAGSDVINALGGNDRINGTPGDFIDGGAGLDTVVLSGFGWLPSKTSSGWSFKTFDGGQVNLVNVERVQTNVASIVALDVDGIAGTVYRVYQAAFARKPDIGGVSYWINEMDKGGRCSMLPPALSEARNSKASTVRVRQTLNLSISFTKTFWVAPRTGRHRLLGRCSQ